MAMYNAITGLLAAGAQVTLLSINTRKHHRHADEIAAHQPPGLRLEYANRDTGITVWNALTNLLSKQAFQVSRFYFEAFAERLQKLLQEDDYQWVQLEGLTMAPYLPVIRRHSRARVCLRAHNVEHEIWARHRRHENHLLKKSYLALQNRRLRKLEYATVRECDALVAITERDRSIMAVWPEAPPSLALPTGLDSRRYEPRPGPYRYDLGYLASFDWLPNQQGLRWFMAEVWPLLHRKAPDLKLALAGRGMPGDFKTFAGNGVQLLEKVPDSVAFIQSCQVMMVPLLAGSGMRIKIVENMALGKATVATRVGAEGIKVEPDTNILLADTPEDFARQCLRLLRDTPFRQKVEQAARNTFEEYYEQAALGRQLLTFYNSLS